MYPKEMGGVTPCRLKTPIDCFGDKIIENNYSFENNLYTCVAIQPKMSPFVMEFISPISLADREGFSGMISGVSLIEICKLKGYEGDDILVLLELAKEL